MQAGLRADMSLFVSLTSLLQVTHTMTTSADLQAYATTLFGLTLVSLEGVTTAICYQVDGDTVHVSTDTYIEEVYDDELDSDIEVLTVGKKLVLTKQEARGHYKHHLQRGYTA